MKNNEFINEFRRTNIILLIFAITVSFVTLSYGQYTNAYTIGWENSETNWGGSNTSSRAVVTTDVYSGTSAMYGTGNSGNGRRFTSPAITTDANTTYYAIYWVKSSLASTFGTGWGAAAGSYPTNLTANIWTRVTSEYHQGTSASTKTLNPTWTLTANTTLLVDNVIVYKVLTSSAVGVDVTKPGNVTSATGTNTGGLSWLNGSDSGTGATGIQNTLIFKRTAGSNNSNDLIVKDQSPYAASNVVGNWTIQSISVPPSATSYNTGTFNVGDEYAIVHRDLAYNYSVPVYVAITSGCTPDDQTITSATSVCANSTGNTASVPVSAGGSYAWSITGGTISSGSGTNSITYTAGASGNVVLNCIVTTSGGCASAGGQNKTITINPATTISSQSTATQTKFAGESFNPMTVTASGTGTLSYQWKSSDDNATNTPGDDVNVGTNSNSFTPSSASAGTKYYYCVVTGDCGTATSAVSGAIITNNIVPTVALTSGSNSTSVNVNAAMTSAVYTYSYVGDDANVSAEWYTDGTYLSTTSAPSGLSITRNAEANTVTVSGTPTNGVYGTLYYKIIVNETNGNYIEGTITVNVPTPTVTFTSAAGTNAQTRKAGSAITNITYTVTNASGATVSGLPTGLSGSYDNGTFTISGTIDNAATLGTANYTVAATPYTGFGGGGVTASGSVVVKSATAKEICYLVVSGVSANDTQIYPNLNSNTNYIVTLRNVVSPAPAPSVYDTYDLIILTEIVQGDHVEALALKNVNKPILSFKAFTYTSPGRWAWGTPNNGRQLVTGTVTIKQPNHPIFSGISLNNGTLDVLTGMNGTSNGIQVVDVTVSGGITVATAPKTTPFDMATAIHDVPGSVRGAGITSRYILIPIANANYNQVTANGLTLINNAINYLINGEQYVAEPIHFRSRATGNWASTTLWDSSPDNTHWGQHVEAPTSNSANSVAIQSGHTITVAANASASALNVKPTANLTINAVNTLTVTGNITLESSTVGTGTLINNGTLTVSGTASVQQHLTSGRNWYFASPVSNATSNVIKGTAGNQLWERNVAGNSWSEIAGTTADLTPARGYIAKVAQTGVVTFTGTLNNGQVQYPIIRHGVNSGQFHLVGNPYASYLDWQSVVTANPNVMSTMWFRTTTATNAYMFATVLMSDGIPIVAAPNASTTVTKFIPPMQGFWVRINDGVTEGINFTVNNTMRSHADQSGNRFKAPATQHQLLRLEISNGTNNDEAVLYFSGNASDAFDRYDSPKMFNNNAAIPEIYTRAGNERLVINGMNGYNFNTMIALGFNTGQVGSFTIRASQLDNFDNDTQVYLFDKSSNTQFNLSAGEAYSFSADATSTEDRFAVMFKSASGTSSVDANVASGMYLSGDNGRLTLQLNTAIDNAKVTVFAASGQSIHLQAVSAPVTVLNKTLSAGVYLVKVENAGRTTVLRTVLK